MQSRHIEINLFLWFGMEIAICACVQSLCVPFFPSLLYEPEEIKSEQKEANDAMKGTTTIAKKKEKAKQTTEKITQINRRKKNILREKIDFI